MGNYSLVLGIQLVIFVVCALAGVWAFRLRWSSSLLAVALALPAPLFSATGGTAGFIYLPDIIAYLSIPWVLLSWLSKQGTERQRLPLFLGAASILLLLPLFSTAFGWLTAAAGRDIRFVVVELGRGIGYLLVFRLMTQHARSEQRSDSMLALQCIAFMLTCICGLVQFYLHVNLDLWNQVARIYEPSRYEDIGGGFMGLYRGAVGAWCVGIVGVAPVVFIFRRTGVFWAPIISVICMGAALGVGSRQGVGIGLVVLAVASFASLAVAPPLTRVSAAGRWMAMICVLIVLAIVGWSGTTGDFRQFTSSRFDSLINLSQLPSLIAQRSPIDMAHSWAVITGDPLIFLFGTGYGFGSTVEHRFVYVDSEALWVWEIGGVILVVAYAAFIMVAAGKFLRRFRFADITERAVLASAVLVLFGGVLLCYGHLFLLHTRSPEAPVGYWAWSVLGLATGLIIRPFEPQRNTLLDQDSYYAAQATTFEHADAAH